LNCYDQWLWGFRMGYTNYPYTYSMRQSFSGKHYVKAFIGLSRANSFGGQISPNRYSFSKADVWIQQSDYWPYYDGKTDHLDFWGIAQEAEIQALTSIFFWGDAKNYSLTSNIKPKVTKSCVLYDPKGNVVHIHEHQCEGDASPISNKELEKSAVDSFNSIMKKQEMQGSSPKIQASKLKVLHISPESIKRDSYVTYKVDLTNESLVTIPQELPCSFAGLHSYANEIAKLADLKASGEITPEEFLLLKKKIIKS
jgi:hypothetical protein